MRRTPRVCILGCSGSTTGEVSLALDWVKRCTRRMELHAVVGSGSARAAHHAGATVHSYPNLGTRTSLQRIQQSLKELAPDVVIIADLLLYHGLVGEFRGALPQVVAASCPDAALVGLDLYDWDAHANVIDIFGRPAMAHFARNGEVPPAPRPPSSMGRLMPAPYLVPAHSTPGRGRYAMMGDQGSVTARQRRAARTELGLPDGMLVLLTTSPWQHLAEQYVESARVAAALPALMMRLLGLAAREVEPVTLVHLGPAPYRVPDDVTNLGYLHLPQLPPPRFQRLLQATDLMLTPNMIASSAIRAASMRIPVATLHVGAATSTSGTSAAQDALRRFHDVVTPGYATSVWPLGMHALMSRILENNPFRQIQEHLDVYRPDETVDRLARLLRGTADVDALRGQQEEYFQLLRRNTDTPDDALEAALVASGTSTVRRRPDRVQRAWKSGFKYFWDREFHDEIMARVPATRPARDPLFWEVWPACRDHSLCDPWRAENICARLLEVKDLEGDIIECGTWRGGVSVMLALLCRKLGLRKKVYMLDSFQGLPRPDPGVDHFHREGWCAAPRMQVEELITRTGVGDLVVIREGWFRDTLPGLTDERFCLAHLDGDLYQSTAECLRHLAPRMVERGVVVVDDYHDTGEGVKRAVDEHLAITGEALQAGPIPQVYFRRSVLARRRGALSTRELRANTAYARMIQEVARAAQRDADAVAALHDLIAG
ncbi:MAG: DUF6365 family protein [Myxococcota bacterium]